MAHCARFIAHKAEYEALWVTPMTALLAEVRQAPVMDGLDLVPEVTTTARYPWTEPSWRAA